MSITATNGAWAHIEQRDMTPASALVLLALARRHNQETGRCDPSLLRLSRDTGLGERTVRGAIRQLEALGVIVTIHRKRRTGLGKKNLTNRYKISGAKSAGGMGQNLPGKREDIPSAFDDLAMSIEGGLWE